MKHARSSLFALITGSLAAAAVASLSLEGVARADEEVDPVLAAAPVLPASGTGATLPAGTGPASPASPASPELAPLPGAQPPATKGPAPLAGPASDVEHDSGPERSTAVLRPRFSGLAGSGLQTV